MRLTGGSKIGRSPGNYSADFPEKKHVLEGVVVDSQLAHDLTRIHV